jgi:SpoVK/Ycf46/Vps4 family AAA+-type ATPase
MVIYPHQRGVFAELQKRAEIYFSGKWIRLPIKPRFHTLIVGSTGTGKTALATNLAEHVGASLHRISASNWIPLGANNRGAKETLTSLCDAILLEKRSIIFIDEIDKISFPTSWLTHVRTEIFDLLDASLPIGLELDSAADEESRVILKKTRLERAQDRLRNHVFMLAAGAFQDFFDQPKARSIGFLDTQQLLPKAPDSSEIARRLPRELTNRFHGNLLVLPPLQEKDYEELASSIQDSLPPSLQRPFARAFKRLIPEAVRSRKGCRFLEEALLDALAETTTPSVQL